MSDPMLQNQPEPGGGDRLPVHVWETIVRITNEIGTSEAKSIRVLLYLALIAEDSSNFRYRLRRRLNFFRSLAAPSGKTLLSATKGLPLFAFLYGTPANTNNLFPVFEAARMRDLNPTILAGPSFSLASQGLLSHKPALQYSDLMRVATMKERFAAIKGAGKHFDTVLHAIERQFPHWTGVLKHSRESVVSELVIGLIASYGLRRLYELWEPRFVISTSNFWPSDCAMFDEARRFGIPSFILQHGVNDRICWPFAANQMLLWGEPFKQEVLTFGSPSERLAVCGMPATDSLFAQHHHRAEAGIYKPASSYVVLSHTHAWNENPGLYSRYMELFRAVVKATPETQWSIKLHPNEDERFYRDMLNSRVPNFRIHPKSVALAAAVKDADVACTLFSTSGLEAMIMGKPLIVFDVDPSIREYAWWPKHGGGSYVRTVDEMLEYVRSASSSSHFIADIVFRQEDFLTRSFANSGRAAEAILDNISAFLNAAVERASHTSPTEHLSI